MPEAYKKAEQRRLIGLVIQQAFNEFEKWWPGRQVEATIIDAGNVQLRIGDKHGPVQYYTIKITANW